MSLISDLGRALDSILRLLLLMCKLVRDHLLRHGDESSFSFLFSCGFLFIAGLFAVWMDKKSLTSVDALTGLFSRIHIPRVPFDHKSCLSLRNRILVITHQKSSCQSCQETW